MTAIFFAAHQDDEVLFMGAAIREHVLAGRRTMVVLCTTGQNSSVAPIYPSTEEFINERDREFNRAVRGLGAEAVIDPDRAIDGNLTVTKARAIIEKYIVSYNTGDLSLKTLSYYDTHSDHKALGEALKATSHNDKRYYLRREQWDTYSGSFTKVYDLRDALLDYAPVAWLSTRSLCEATWLDGRSKVHK